MSYWGEYVEEASGSRCHGVHDACPFSCGVDVVKFPVFAGRKAVCGAKGAAEVGGAGEAPPGRDGMNGAGVQLGIGQIVSAAFQPASADPVGDREPLVLEDLVELTRGDPVSRGDGAGREGGITEPLPDELVDLRLQRPPVRLWWQRVDGLQLVGAQGREQVRRDGRQAGGVGCRAMGAFLVNSARWRDSRAPSPPRCGSPTAMRGLSVCDLMGSNSLGTCRITQPATAPCSAVAQAVKGREVS